MKDSLFLILDSDAYLASKQNGTSSLEQSLGKNEGREETRQAQKRQKNMLSMPVGW